MGHWRLASPLMHKSAPGPADRPGVPRRKPEHPAPSATSSASPAHARIDGERLVAHLIRVEAHVLELQRELEHAQRLAVLGTLTAGIAHEFNNLMTPVLSYAQMALEAPDDPALVRKALERAVFGASSASRVAAAILAMAKDRPASGDAEPDVADVGDAVRGALAVIARDPSRDNVDLILHVPEGLRAPIRPIALQQVVVNLVLNALRAMKGQGGPRTLRIFAMASPAAVGDRPEGSQAPAATAPCSTWNTGESSAGAAGSRIELVIEDTGPGFDPAAGLAQGHGIGLKISRRMLEQAGGSLEIRSPMSASGGTRCTIALATI